jgi:HSP20 family protein
MLFVPATRRAPVAYSRPFDALFDDSFDRVFRAPRAPAAFAPSMDVAESDAAYTVTLDVPGLTREQLKVSIEGKQLRVESKPAAAAAQEGVRSLYRERSVRPFARSVELPAEVDESASQAKLENGVLTLTLAKKVPTGRRQISVN